ncbi:hypothetical protein V8C44DRAFT_164252 [Trichoderma aethiopicum]
MVVEMSSKISLARLAVVGMYMATGLLLSAKRVESMSLGNDGEGASSARSFSEEHKVIVCFWEKRKKKQWMVRMSRRADATDGEVKMPGRDWT